MNGVRNHTSFLSLSGSFVYQNAFKINSSRHTHQFCSFLLSSILCSQCVVFIHWLKNAVQFLETVHKATSICVWNLVYEFSFSFLSEI